MKSLVLSVIIAMTFVVNAVSSNHTNNFAYSSEVNEGCTESQTVFKVESQKYLHNHLKYNYTYDSAGRILQKEVLKWNKTTQTFEKHHCLNFCYADNLTIEYATWNEKNNAYSDIKEKSVYQSTNGTLRYLSYEWDQKENSWNLKMEHNTAYWNDALLAKNKLLFKKTDCICINKCHLVS